MTRFWLVTALLLPCLVTTGLADIWVQTDWEGGRGQLLYGDTTKYWDGWSEDVSTGPGELRLRFPGWECTGELTGATYVWCLLEAADGSIYAGTQPSGDIFRSVDGGNTWTRVGGIPGAARPWQLAENYLGFLFATARGLVFISMDGGATWLQAGDMPPMTKYTYGILADGQSLYVGAYSTSAGGRGRVYRSTNNGVVWDTTAPLPEVMHPYALFKDKDATIWVGGCAGNGCVDWTTDGGLTWGYREHIGWVYDFAQASDGAVFLASSGHVWKTYDQQSWLDLGPLSGLEMVNCVLASDDGSVYAGGDAEPESTAYIYRTTDGGSTWVRTGDVMTEDVGSVNDFIQTADGTLYASGASSERACVFRFSRSEGWIESSVFRAGNSPEYGEVCWTFTTQGDSPVVKVRTDLWPGMSGAPDWDSCPAAVNGQDMSELSSVDDGDLYVQYRIEMEGWDQFSTPALHEIRLEYTPTGIAERGEVRVEGRSGLVLRAAPSPCAGKTVLYFILEHTGPVVLSVCDLGGRRVRVLIDGELSAGEHSMIWNGADAAGNLLPTGIYFCNLVADARTTACKLVLVR